MSRGAWTRTLPNAWAMLDAIALECLGADAWAARRWLRLAPGFLGRMANGLRLLRCDREFAARFIEQVRQRVDRGEIPVAFEIRSHYRGMQESFCRADEASAWKGSANMR